MENIEETTYSSMCMVPKNEYTYASKNNLWILNRLSIGEIFNIRRIGYSDPKRVWICEEKMCYICK